LNQLHVILLVPDGGYRLKMMAERMRFRQLSISA